MDKKKYEDLIFSLSKTINNYMIPEYIKQNNLKTDVFVSLATGGGESEVQILKRLKDLGKLPKTLILVDSDFEGTSDKEGICKSSECLSFRKNKLLDTRIFQKKSETVQRVRFFGSYKDFVSFVDKNQKFKGNIFYSQQFQRSITFPPSEEDKEYSARFNKNKTGYSEPIDEKTARKNFYYFKAFSKKTSEPQKVKIINGFDGDKLKLERYIDYKNIKTPKRTELTKNQKKRLEYFKKINKNLLRQKDVKKLSLEDLNGWIIRSVIITALQLDDKDWNRKVPESSGQHAKRFAISKSFMNKLNKIVNLIFQNENFRKQNFIQKKKYLIKNLKVPISLNLNFSDLSSEKSYKTIYNLSKAFNFNVIISYIKGKKAKTNVFVSLGTGDGESEIQILNKLKAIDKFPKTIILVDSIFTKKANQNKLISEIKKIEDDCKIKFFDDILKFAKSYEENTEYKGDIFFTNLYQFTTEGYSTEDMEYIKNNFRLGENLYKMSSTSKSPILTNPTGFGFEFPINKKTANENFNLFFTYKPRSENIQKLLIYNKFQYNEKTDKNELGLYNEKTGKK
ncbi:hypothetical protein GF385_04165 [Candidatus Dependentiae bacterium]|nr:hypothetical protein [Candidatus Dependentiae bacterium]